MIGTCPTSARCSAATCSGRSSPTRPPPCARTSRACPLCATEHDALAGLPELLDLSARGWRSPAEPLPAGRRGAPARRVARDRGRRGGRAPAAGRARACSCPRRRSRPGCGGGVRADGRRGRPRAGSAAARRPRPGYDIALRTAPAPRAPRAGARIARAHDRRDDAAPVGPRSAARSRAVYEVRCDGPGWTASAGTFRADRSGRAYAALTTAARVGGVRPHPRRATHARGRRRAGGPGRHPCCRRSRGGGSNRGTKARVWLDRPTRT